MVGEQSPQDQEVVKTGTYHGPSPLNTTSSQAPQAPPSHQCHGFINGSSNSVSFDASRYSPISNSNAAVLESNNTNASSSSSLARPTGPYSAAVSSPHPKGSVSAFKAPSPTKTTKTTTTTTPPRYASYEKREDPQHWGCAPAHSSVGLEPSSAGRLPGVVTATTTSTKSSPMYGKYRAIDDRAPHRASATVPVTWGAGGGVRAKGPGPPPPPPPPPPPHRYGGPYEVPYQPRGGGGAPGPPPQSYAPPVVAPSSINLHHPHHPVPPYRYPYTTRLEEASSVSQSQQQRHVRKEAFNDVDGREGATSPSQIESTHRDEVTNMGCTCKKTKCLKLYCQCFAVKIYCGPNCRCLVCFNIAKHEKHRKEAMRNILSRNASAFDTKFLKTKERVTTEPQLAHKLGCKCRKSACMKKYCECYAGNVKCSATCRCVGCKNTPPGGFGGSSGSDAPLASVPRSVNTVGSDYDIASKGIGGPRNGEPWMMNAAQKLTFLKHGSPSNDSRVHAQEIPSEAASMPSLAASSSDTSPDDNPVEETTSIKPSLSPSNDGEDRRGGAVNTLLMAAYAMTELPSRNPAHSGGFESPQEVKPPHPTGMTVGTGTPQKFQTRKELFRASPKRKSEEAGVAGTSKECDCPQNYHQTLPYFADNRMQPPNPPQQETVHTSEIPPPQRMHTSPPPVLATPSMDHRKIKRTRLGSVCKKMSWEFSSETHPDGENTTTIVQETPKGKSDPMVEKLTPVSARCVDFRRMHVNDNSSSELEPS